MKRTKLRLLWSKLALFLLIPISACNLFEYHPYAGNLEFKNLTAENVEKIKAQENLITNKPSFKFAFISDTQGFFAETADMVKSINNRDVAFVLHGGDITNYAFTSEFERMHREFAKLKVPYVTVIGNHDCLGDGDKIYKEMYGPLDHSFTFGKNKFIFLNTNHLEFINSNIPDLNWLSQELRSAPADGNIFVIAHIIPNHPDANPDKELAYASLMRQYNVRLSLHGHSHGYRAGQLYDDGIEYVTTPSANKRAYIMVTVTGQQASYELIEF